MGAAAVEALRQGHCDCMIGLQFGEMKTVAYDNVIGKKKTVSRELVQLAKMLSV